MPAVESRAIRSVDYDAESRTLFVRFIDGDLYAYFDVPPKVYDDFRTARSKGGFFARRVRDRYRYKKIGGEDDPDLFPASPGTPSGGPASPPPAAAAR